MTLSDRAGIEDLFAYTDFAWRQFTQVIADSGGDEVLVQAAPGSGWPGLRECLGHIILAYHRWLGDPVRGLPQFDPGAHSTLAKIESHRAQVRREFRARLDSTSDDDLTDVRSIEVDGEMLPYSRGELLAHLLLHERGHHGDVTTLFYQLGIQHETSLEYRFHLLGQRT